MAVGLSGSKGGITHKEKIDGENYVILFKEIIKLRKNTQNGSRFFRQ